MSQNDTSWSIGELDDFVEMYDATVDAAYRYARRLAGSQDKAEDLVQQVYMELLHAARDGKVDRVGTGRIIVAIRSRFLNSLRSQDRERRRLQLVVDHPSASHEPTRDDASDMLRHADLTDRERAALTLRYVDDLPVNEVARALNTSVRATESLLARARHRLRDAEQHHG